MPSIEKPKSLHLQLAANTVLLEQLQQAARYSIQQRRFTWRSNAQRVLQLFESLS